MATWQSTTVEINPGAYYEMSIMSGKANVFYAVNASEQDIYISLNGIPRLNSYETILRRKSSDVFGRPTNVSRVYFYNAATEKVNLQVWFTYSEVFDFSMLKTLNVNIEGSITDELKFDGIIKGFQTGITLPVTDTPLKNVAEDIKTILQNGQQTNATILEGINTILESL